jgi:hypothetical protein
MIEAGTGISTKDNSYEAGKTVADKALEMISTDPKLAILGVDSLTRVKYNYKDVLKGVRDVIGQDVILIGSTTNGVLVNDRFALHSVGLMVLGGDFFVDASFNFGKSRLEYEKIARQIHEIAKNLEDNDDRFLLMFQDGMKFPPEVLKKQETLNSRVVSLFSGLVNRFFKKQLEDFKEEGQGMPSVQELLEELYSQGWENRVVGNVATNVRNYDSVEFYNNEVGDDNVIGVFLTPQNKTKFGFGFAAGAEPTGNKCVPTKNIGSFLLRIDDEPALIGLCNAANIKMESLHELKTADYLNYHTILGTQEKIGNSDYIHLTATITNPEFESLLNTGFPFERVPDEIEIFRSNMDILIKTAVDTVTQAIEGIPNPKFFLGFDCAIRLFAYGDNIPTIVKKINKTIGKDIPKMILGSGGEIYGNKDLDYYFNNMAFVSIVGGD